MCGIAGVFLKDPSLEPALGATLAGMLTVLSDRGPDSAGFAIYGAPAAGREKLTVRLPPGLYADALAAELSACLDTDVTATPHGDHAVLAVDADSVHLVRHELARRSPPVAIVGTGQRMELFKGVGQPAEVCARFGLQNMAGTHAIGHTRMATESAVTTAGAHPFSTGTDQCLVHNGSLSNHNSVRRRLAREGFVTDTGNDSEVAALYLSWQMSTGASLDQALSSSLSDLDGFYTFVVSTRDGFGVLRDPVACKPAVMAETDLYVAFGSEYRALVDLPDIAHANIFEPVPAQVYFWSRAAG